MLTPTERQLDWLAARIPDLPRSPLGGQPPVDKRKTIQGIFWILDNGVKWKDLPSEFGSKSSRHRWFQRWVRDRVFETIKREAGRSVEERRAYKLYECFIDGTFSKARGGGDGIGCTRVGKGVKIMMLVDVRVLPVALDAMSAAPHECTLVQGLFDFTLTQESPERFVGHKACDGDGVDQAMAERGVELIVPHRTGRKPENITQDGRPMRRYARRWTVERTIGWFQNFRRLCIRWEESTTLFQAFLHFGCAMLLLKTVLG